MRSRCLRPWFALLFAWLFSLCASVFAALPREAAPRDTFALEKPTPPSEIASGIFEVPVPEQAGFWRVVRVDALGKIYLLGVRGASDVRDHGFRYYDPEIGRYLTRDPIGYADGLNVYVYVKSNPINSVDPLGLEQNMRLRAYNPEVDIDVEYTTSDWVSYEYNSGQGAFAASGELINDTMDWMASPEGQQALKPMAMGAGEAGLSYVYPPASLALDIKDGGVALGDLSQGHYGAGAVGLLGVMVGVVGEYFGGDVIKQGLKPAADALRKGMAPRREMGARHIASDAHYLDELVTTGRIPANPRGTYFTLDESYDALTPFRLQVPHDGAIRVEFPLSQLGDDIAVPLGNWGKGPHLEPFARDFPDFGFGGASQRTTTSPIQAERIIDTRTGEILFQR